MPPHTGVESTATLIFAIAVLHTFAASRIAGLADRWPRKNWRAGVFHLLGEVELVFGFWAGVLLIAIAILQGPGAAFSYLAGREFVEPLFVFAAMLVSSTLPIIALARKLILRLARIIPLSGDLPVYGTCLFVGPLLGSLITEPAAMTVTALLLRDRYYSRGATPQLMYVTLATLFVNVSLGGVLTHFAAPPILMVSKIWGWGTPFLFQTFGWKAVIAIAANSAMATWICREELKSSPLPKPSSIPRGLAGLHVGILACLVAVAHSPSLLIGLLLFFLGVAAVSTRHQEALKIRESALVASFLAGLVVLGGLQSWWIAPLFSQLGAGSIYLGTAALTAVTDNATLTYLGAQIPGLADPLKIALVAGAVAGGGLTVIANAPNPAGYSILQKSFGPKGISPWKLFLHACLPTAIALISLSLP